MYWNHLHWFVALTCERASRREGATCTREQNNKTEKYTRLQIVHFYRLLQVDVSYLGLSHDFVIRSGQIHK